MTNGTEGSSPALAELRFLVVEDQGFQLWIIGKMLEDLGARYVFTAADGASALQVLSAQFSSGVPGIATSNPVPWSLTVRPASFATSVTHARVAAGSTPAT